MVRLLVQFTNSSLPSSVNVYEQLSREMEEADGFKCEIRSWLDTEGLLGVQIMFCHVMFVTLRYNMFHHHQPDLGREPLHPG
jgi:hypothetical protein